MARVQLRGITKHFGVVCAVDNATLLIESGVFFTLLGPSGCGKTTLLRIISGFETPTRGEVFIDNDDVTLLQPERRHVGMVFQSYALFPHMTVFENVAYGLRVQHMTRGMIRRRVEKYLALVRLSGYEERKISELSGGQQQRVALARSLAVEPRILLLDEPLSNLDAKLRDEMRIELKQIQRELGVTTVYVTHDQGEALTMSDTIAVMNLGVIQQMGSPQEIYDRPVNAFVAGFVGDTNMFRIETAGETASLEGGLSLRLTAARKGDFVSIRPEAIDISRKRNGGVNVLEGIVEFQQFGGALNFYIVKTGDTTLRIRKPHTQLAEDLFGVGEQVFLSIDPSGIRSVPGVDA